MKTVLVGIGVYGYGWHEKILNEYKDIELVIVDKGESAFEKMQNKSIRFYSSFKYEGASALRCYYSSF